MPELSVDLDTLATNIVAVQRHVAPAELMLVVKDDAYGHGLEPVALRAQALGVRWFGAFDISTATRVRRVLGDGPRIFVWMALSDHDIDSAIDLSLDLGIGTPELLEHVRSRVRARSDGAVLAVHLKIDSGLRRNGIRPEQWLDTVRRARELEHEGHVKVAGIWSHIAEASDAEDDDARARYVDALGVARSVGLTPDFGHLAASAAAFARPEFRFDMVRIGAFCYGIRSAGGPDEASLGIAPVARFRSRIQEVGAAVRLDAGALHGLPSTLAGRLRLPTPDGWRMLTHIGDTTSLVEPWPTARVGDDVTVWGSGARSATDIAELIDSIGEEITVRVSPLVHRSYVCLADETVRS